MLDEAAIPGSRSGPVAIGGALDSHAKDIRSSTKRGVELAHQPYMHPRFDLCFVAGQSTQFLGKLGVYDSCQRIYEEGMRMRHISFSMPREYVEWV